MNLNGFGIGKMFRMMAAGVAAVVFGSAVQAGSVIGTQAFSVGSTSLDTSSITTATTITFTTITTSNPETGDFLAAGLPLGTAAGSGVFTIPSSFTFGNSSFGYFTATGFNYDQSVGTSFRNIELTGTFAGGTLFPGKNDLVNAKLDISLNQVGGPNTAIGATFSLVTTAIPEPSSVVMMGLGVAGLLGVGRIRRK